MPQVTPLNPQRPGSSQQRRKYTVTQGQTPVGMEALTMGKQRWNGWSSTTYAPARPLKSVSRDRGPNSQENPDTPTCTNSLFWPLHRSRSQHKGQDGQTIRQARILQNVDADYVALVKILRVHIERESLQGNNNSSDAIHEDEALVIVNGISCIMIFLL